jgi:hypothetical protein
MWRLFVLPDRACDGAQRHRSEGPHASAFHYEAPVDEIVEGIRAML